MLSKICCFALLSGLMCLMLATTAAAQESNHNPVFAARAAKAFQDAQAGYSTNTNDPALACHFASTCFDLTFFATNDDQRADIARLGIAACRQIVAQNTNSGPGHYWLAMNLGELAQAEAPSIAAYKLVHEVEREFKIADDLDAKVDYAGPARNLGELYFQAPGWPLSIGSKRKARDYLERAAQLAPNYPENQLNLLEARLKWRQRDEAEATLKMLGKIWPGAHREFTGPSQEKNWVDWSAERASLQAEFDRLYPAADAP